jgi:hypothetical protein
MMLLLLFLAFHFVAVIGGSLTGFNGFHFSLESRVYEIYLGSRKNQLVSVLWPLLLHGCTKETILKLFRTKLFLSMFCLHLI